MKRLILMRHAKSDWSAGVSSDHDRPLNARGRRGATVLGIALRDKAIVPDQILSSTALRTRETCEFLGLDGSPKVSFQRGLYLATQDEIFGALQRVIGDVVLMLGHNPGIAIAASQFVDCAPDHPRFDDYPSGATLVVDFDIGEWDAVAWQSGRVADFFTPHDFT